LAQLNDINSIDISARVSAGLKSHARLTIESVVPFLPRGDAGSSRSRAGLSLVCALQESRFHTPGEPWRWSDAAAMAAYGASFPFPLAPAKVG